MRTRDVWYGVPGYIWRTEMDGMEVEAWDGRRACGRWDVVRHCGGGEAGDGDVHGC